MSSAVAVLGSPKISYSESPDVLKKENAISINIIFYIYNFFSFIFLQLIIRFILEMSRNCLVALITSFAFMNFLSAKYFDTNNGNYIAAVESDKLLYFFKITLEEILVFF